MNKPLVQNTLIVLLFVLVALAFNYPVLQGMELHQSDVQHWKGMSWEAREWYKKTGETTLWSNSMFGGMPTATYAVYGIPSWLGKIVDVVTNNLPIGFYSYLIAMIGFFLLSRALAWNRWIGVIGGIAYAFLAYHAQILVSGHNTKVLCLAYLPAIFAGVHWMFHRKLILGAAVTLLFSSLSFAAGMYQIIYYQFIILGFVILGYLVKAIQEKRLASFFLPLITFVALVGLSIGPSIASFFYTKDYTDATMRGGKSEFTLNKKEKKTNGGLDRDYAFAWSQGIGETFTLLVPNLYGGGGSTNLGTNSETYEVVSQFAGEENGENFAKHAPMYWGPQPFLAGPHYFGAIIIFLMVLSLFLINSRMKWFLFGAGVLGIMMSWGKHFPALNYFLFDHLPMYNKFRTPNMIMIIPGFTFTALALWALHDVLFGNREEGALVKALKNSGIIVGGLCLLLTLGSQFAMDYKGDNDAKSKAQLVQMFGGNEEAGSKVFAAMVSDRSSIALKDGFRSLVFIALAFGLLWMFAKRKLAATIALAGCGALIAVDALSISTRYMNAESFIAKEDVEAEFMPRPVDQQILQDTDPYYRVFDLSRDPFNDALGAVHHKMVGGYSPAKMEIFQDIIDQYFGQGKLNAQILNMLNTKYLIFNGQDNKPATQMNPGACGNAWFVQQIKPVANADEEVLALNAENLGDTSQVQNAFKAKEMAIVRKAIWKNNATSFLVDSSSSINLTKYGLNDLSYSVNNAHEGFAVFSDIYYEQGWKAYIDGKEAPIYKTNYILRGLLVPAGKHEIKFEFKPESYTKWVGATRISSILVVLLSLAGIAFSVIKKKPEDH